MNRLTSQNLFVFILFPMLLFAGLGIYWIQFPTSNNIDVSTQEENEKKSSFEDSNIPEPSILDNFSNDFRALPDPNLLNNSALLESAINHVYSENIRGSRDVDLLSTYYVCKILKNLNYTLFNQYKTGFTNYILSLFNSSSVHFVEPINYTAVLISPYGSTMERSIRTPLMTNEIAIIILAECSSLESNFDAYTRWTWEQEILMDQNIDGGFGDTISGNSTLIETFYSVNALLALHDFDSSFLSSFQIQSIKNYLNSRQRTSDWAPFAFGAFNEYNNNNIFGWEDFYSSWLTAQIYDLLGGASAEVGNLFGDFVENNGILNPNTNSFYPTWNDQVNPEVTFYKGTAIIGMCLEIFNQTSRFDNYSVAKEKLVNGTFYSHLENTTGAIFNYFVNDDKWANDYPVDDLLTQFIIINYLKKANILHEFTSQTEQFDLYIDQIVSRINFKGGASFISEKWVSVTGEFERYYALSILSNNSPYEIDNLVNHTKLCENILSAIQDDHFEDYNQNFIFQNSKEMYLFLPNQQDQYEIKSTCYALQLIDKYNLTAEFSQRISNNFQIFEQWIADQFDLNGFVIPDISVKSTKNFSLEATYFAIVAEKILLDIDPEHDWSNYFSVENISTIRSFVAQFILESDEFYYMQSPSDMYLDNFQTTDYVFSILDILGWGNISFQQNKFNDYLIFQFSEWNNLSNLNQYHLLSLMNYVNFQFPKDFVPFNHQWVQEFATNLVEKNTISSSECIAFARLFQINNLHVSIEVPQDIEIGTIRTFGFQFWSLLSIEAPSEKEFVDQTKHYFEFI
ncbi:MAG: hypothetical protein ACTSWL_09270, partial [Promethearchaeota archaeon]